MNIRTHVLLMTVVLVLSLSGCASTPSSNTKPAATSDETRTKTEGAAMGALVGGLLGLAVGHDNRGQAALIGAALGAGTGYLVGNEIAKRKKQYVTEEEFLDGEITSAREFNQTAEKYNASLEQDIDRLDRETLALKAQYDADRISYSRLDEERELIAKKIESSSNVLKDLREEQEIKGAIYEEQKEKRPSDDTYVVQLEQELNLLKENIDTLNQHSQQLARIDDRLSR